MIQIMRCINRVAVNVFWAVDMQQQHQQLSQFQSMNVKKMIVLKVAFVKRVLFAIKPNAFRPLNVRFENVIIVMKFM